MSFRKERKYKLTVSDQNVLKNKLISKGMKLLHPKREVNSIYFDTNNLDFYLNSEEGILPRKKIRLRWYNKDIKKINKETKISSIEGRFKTSEPFSYTKNIFMNNFQLIDNEFGILKPQIQITYNREYFFLNDLRITFDSNIQYINIASLNNLKTKDKECVMEIKVNFRINDDYIEKIIDYPTSRFSKYSRSILYTKRLI
ncbi:VTC domain-containing protein [Candidatus Pelagibacter sp.]|nr:VTC domain-containing protein [Candidatus Pelagibacter sp.]